MTEAVSILRASLAAVVVMMPRKPGSCDYCGSFPARAVRGRKHLGPMCSSCTSDYFESFKRTGWTKVEPEAVAW